MSKSFILARAFFYLSGFIFLFSWIALSLRPLDEHLAVTLPGWVQNLGILLMIAGGTLVVICGLFFVMKGRGTPAIFDAPTEFVPAGPYKYVRNPIYIGGFVLYAGFGLFHRSISMTIFSLILFLLFHLFVVFVEEPGLERRFGRSYLEYKKSTNRWLPKLGRG